MNNDLIDFLPIILISALFIIFIWRRQTLGKFDWETIAAIALGLSLLATVIKLVLEGRSAETVPLEILLIAIPTLIFGVFLLFATGVATVEKMKAKFRMDERLTIINVRSARNALVAVYLDLIVDVIVYAGISRELLLAMIGASLVVYLVSFIIYYYRSF
jgi:hypothetical protein